MRTGAVAAGSPLPATTAATTTATRSAATSELDRLRGGGDETNGPEQAGGHERRVGREFADIGPRDPLVFRPGQVTDEAVGPEGGDTYHEAGLARAGGRRDVGAEPRAPQGAPP